MLCPVCKLSGTLHHWFPQQPPSLPHETGRSGAPPASRSRSRADLQRWIHFINPAHSCPHGLKSKALEMSFLVEFSIGIVSRFNQWIFFSKAQIYSDIKGYLRWILYFIFLHFLKMVVHPRRYPFVGQAQTQMLRMFGPKFYIHLLREIFKYQLQWFNLSNWWKKSNF